MTVEFKDKKEQRILAMFFGVASILIGLFKIFEPEQFEWTNTWFLGFAILYVVVANYRMKKQYITIENGVISKHSIFSKSLKLSDIKQIQKKSDKYILNTEFRKLTINTKLIAEKSLADLNSELDKLNVEWN